MKWAALVCLTLGTGLLCLWTMKDPWRVLEELLGDFWVNYRHFCERRIGFLQVKLTFKGIVKQQLSIFFAVACLAIGLGVPMLWMVTPIIVIYPKLMLERQRRDRVAKLETQLDGWLLALANSLKASPSLGDGLKETASLMHAPMSQELSLLMKEYALGIPLDQALNDMADRIGSQTVRTGVTTLLVARESGGDLPSVLETTAAALREMARLEGVVRTKTAEGKAQAYVLGAVPPVMFGTMYYIDPSLVRPLLMSGTGNVVFAAAIVLWILSIPVGIRVLTVDI